jgi:protein-tyrosine-phosphatase/DNA-binding transcriptional regulator YhcF (GntR family)
MDMEPLRAARAAAPAAFGSAGAEVGRLLRDAILAGRWPAGAQIKQQPIAEELGVSHIPVREALKTLESEGFVVLAARRGYFVAPVSVEDAREIWHLRRTLEPMAIAASVPRAGGAHFARAEALLRDMGRGRFTAHSAGTRPNTLLNPFALEVLARNGHDLSGLRSKHISEFQQAQSPEMDFVFTVCDAAAAEECPPWPGQPITGHWGLPDPVKAEGNEAEKALVFAQTYAALRRRIAAFVELPFDTLNRLSLQARIDRIDADAAALDKG